MVPMLAITDRGLFREIHFQVDAAIFSQRDDQSFEHLVEAKGMLIEVLSGILIVEANVREIKPAIHANDGDVVAGIGDPGRSA